MIVVGAGPVRLGCQFYLTHRIHATASQVDL